MLHSIILLIIFVYAFPLMAYEFVAAGAYHTIVVEEDGSALAVGGNDFGQLGDGSTKQRHSLVPVMQGVSSVAAGRYHSIFVKSDGTAWATGNIEGSNSQGQLGHASEDDQQTRPVPILNGGIRAAAAGDRHSLFVTWDGAAYAVGDNRHGQLGDGTLQSRASVVKVLEHSVRGVAAGSDHSIFLLDDGNALGAGSNFNGQLGESMEDCGRNCERPESPFQWLRPTKLKDRVAYAVAGGNSTILVDLDGVAWVGGRNDLGQLCSDAWGSIGKFAQIAQLQNISAIGRHHTVLVGRDGIAGLCGLNIHGQLGYVQPLGPLGESVAWQGNRVPVLSDIQSAAVGDEHTVFLDKKGQIWAAGSNAHGQIGSWTMPTTLVQLFATTTQYAPPVSSTTLPKVVELDSTSIFGLVVLLISFGVFGILCGGAIVRYSVTRILSDDVDSNSGDYAIEQE